MNEERINRLITRREKLTNRRDGRINIPAVNEIDAQLATVPVGEREDVDYLLGRVLPKSATTRWSTDAERAEWKDNGAEKTARAAQAKMSEFEAHLKMLCADYDIEAPDTPGMWK